MENKKNIEIQKVKNLYQPQIDNYNREKERLLNINNDNNSYYNNLNNNHNINNDFNSNNNSQIC